MKRKTKRNVLLTAMCFSTVNLFFGCQSTDSKDITVRFAEKNNEAFIGQPLPYEITGLRQDTLKQVELLLLAMDSKKTSYQKDIARTILTKDGDLHDTLLIPEDVKAGAYEIQVRVRYDDGSIQQSKSQLSIKVDSTVPMASPLEVGINAAGNDLHLESVLVVPKGIAYAKVEISANDLKNEYKFDKGHMVGTQQHTFHEHIDLTDYPSGNYHVLLTVCDKENRVATTSGNFQKK